MPYKIDARGLNCPEPVILTKKGIDLGEEHIEIVVDNLAARENVSKMGISQGYEVNVEEKGEEFHITLLKKAASRVAAEPSQEVSILVKSDLFGNGDVELGQTLMKSFLYTLNETAGVKYVVFMNRGVLLTIAGSPVLDHLEALEEKGVSVLSCGTCLDYYQVRDQLAVGAVTNMYSALEILTSTARNLTI
ncbi:MAG: sulfurtransferase-like selenium metabolism protein YedF [Syntrophomonadaceae bacterium]